MKQHISISDLNQLSGEGRERLRKWWKPQEGDFYLDHEEQESLVWCCECDVADRKKSYPLLSIGQMIEFLHDYLKEEAKKNHNTNHPLPEESIHIMHIESEPIPKSNVTQIYFYDDTNKFPGYILKIFHKSPNRLYLEGNSMWSMRFDTLCNDLWETVKEVLEKV